MTYECFISYASEDLKFAEELHARLLEGGFKVWFDKARLSPGCDWHKEIEEGCEQSRIVLPLLTPRWKTKEWTKYETYGAEAIIPLVFEGAFEEVFTPPLLRFQGDAVDVTDKDNPDRWLKLFEALRKLLASPAPEAKEQRISHLRFTHNPFFVGREALMDDIHEKLFTNPTTALTQGHIQAVTALGGVGKTTIAREYAEKFWRCYRQIFWISCKAGVVTEMAGLYAYLFPERTSEGLKETEKAETVLRELKRSDGLLRLVIFDDAVDEDTILNWLPKTGNCHTLITSRFTEWQAGVEQTPVWVLDKEPARLLLLKRARLEWENLTEYDKAACDALADKLGHLPLALEQAAAYIDIQNKGQGQGFSYRKYLVLLEKAENERRLLAKGAKGATEYPDAVFNTWRTTIDQLPPGARAILRLISFMASTPIPFAMILKGASIVGEVAGQLTNGKGAIPEPDELELREWKEALIRYSMIRTEDNEGFSVHNLVQAVERHQIALDLRDAVIDKSTNLLTGFAPYPAFKFENWRAWEVLFPHAEILWSYQIGRSVEKLNKGLLGGLWECHYAKARYEEAIPLAKLLVTIDEHLYGSEHPDTATSLNNLALLLHSKGDYDGAEPLYRRALAIREKVLGPEHPDTALSLNNLAGLLQSKGDYDGAEPLYRRALDIREKVLGLEHPNMALSLNNLAGLLQSKGDYDGAEPLSRRALAIDEKVLGPEHPHRALSLNNLALLLHNKGDYDGAVPLYRRALAINEKVLGPEHPDTATSLNNLALLLHSKGDYDGAEPLYRRALAIREKVLGPEHPDTALSLNNLAGLLQSKGDYDGAEPLYRCALAIREKVLGPEHPDTATSLNNLAMLLFSKGDYEVAEPLYRRALAIDEKVLGPEHPDTATSLNNLAALLDNMKKSDEADILRRRLIDIQSSRSDAQPLTLRQRALDCFNLGEYAKAEELLKRVLEKNFEVPGTCCHLARIDLLIDHDSEARNYISRAWEHRSEATPYVIPRILWFQVALEMLAGFDLAICIGRMKSTLQNNEAFMEWTMQPVLDHIKPRLSEEDHALLTTLVAAMSDKARLADLDQFAVWRDAAPLPIDGV